MTVRDAATAPHRGTAPVTHPDGCRFCGADAAQTVLVADGFPVLCNAFTATADAARAVPVGRFRLQACAACGSLRNAAFDAGLAAYDHQYENSLHRSPTFDGYARDLADDLAARHHVRGATVVEIGSGQGDFLSLLAEHGPAQAYGLDPSLAAPQQRATAGATCTLVPGTVDDLPTDVQPDLLVCRHVLEHVDHPVDLLTQMRRRARPGTALYVEVPDGTYMVDAPAVWDLIYEHVGYFTAAGLTAALERSGWTVSATGTSFGGQYLWAEAVGGAGDAVSDPAAPTPVPHTEALGPARAFAAERHAAIERWQERLVAIEPGRAAVWGAGSKGVAFLNAMAASPAIDAIGAVVDLNERKHGRYVPGVGHRIESPAAVADRIDTVLVMNPIYLEEIRHRAAALGFRADHLAVR